ncbi:MAG: hypothetical protein WCR36_04410 [Bacteroidaceae bacterium]
MGTCKYCGNDAGWFSHSHKECEEKHSKGISDFSAVASLYFTQMATALDIQKAKSRLMTDAFLSEDDICDVSDTEIRNHTASIHRPFSPSSMRIMDEFLNAVGVSYSKINKKGGVDEFTKKLMKGFMVEYFTDKLSIQAAYSCCEKLLAKFPMVQSNIEDAYFYVLNKAATNFLKNGVLSDDEQQKIDDYVHYLSLPVNNLPAAYQNTEVSKLGQMSIIKKVKHGIIPDTGIMAPIILGKQEKIIWVYQGVSIYQEKITREYVGRTGGFSFRIMKGVIYRTGQFKGHPVERSSMELLGNGALYVTNKNLILYSPTRSIKVPYTKLLGITPYSDGVEIQRDGANAKRLTAQGFDPWFLMNLLSQLSNL